MTFTHFFVPAAMLAIASSAMAATPDTDAARRNRMDAAYQSYRAKAAESRFIAGARRTTSTTMAPVKAKRSNKAAGKTKARYAK